MKSFIDEIVNEDYETISRKVLNLPTKDYEELLECVNEEMLEIEDTEDNTQYEDIFKRSFNTDYGYVMVGNHKVVCDVLKLILENDIDTYETMFENWWDENKRYVLFAHNERYNKLSYIKNVEFIES